MIDLEKKHALICGSSQGMGRAVAETMASLGARVTLLARDKEKLEKVKEGLTVKNDFQKHHVCVADFSNPQEVSLALKQVEIPVHILVNNTGGPPAGAAVEVETSAYEQAFKMHFVCNHILVQAVVEGMKKEKYGRIINILSTSVKEPIDGLGISNTVRAAVANWAKSLSKELGSWGITVNNVLPGYTDTAHLQSLWEKKSRKLGISVDTLKEQVKQSIPLRRLATPEEIAWAVCFLASPQASYISGINLPVDGGRLSCL